METPEQKELEQFIHQQLRRLPEREAPENLMGNVFAALAARQNAPWWKQPFTSWPRTTQGLLYATLSLAFVAVVYFAWRPAEALNGSSLLERASSFAWLGRVLDTLASSALMVFRTVPWQWFVALAVVLLAMYAACVATGFALYRITARQGASAA
jgi:hypothetical protein